MVIVKNLVKTYEMGKVKVNALNGVSLEIEKGSFLTVMGSSGSGKSTLLHIIGGIDNLTSGEVMINSKPLSRMNDTDITVFRRTNIGFVFQAFNLMPNLTVEENVRLPLQIAGVNTKAKENKIKELLQFVGLYERRAHKPNQLSGGEQQRVAIARALVIEPKLVLLDEPTGALDSKNSTKILELLQHIHKEYKATIIMVTHSPIAAEYTEKTVFLKDGLVTGSLERKNAPEYSAKAINDVLINL